MKTFTIVCFIIAFVCWSPYILGMLYGMCVGLYRWLKEFVTKKEARNVENIMQAVCLIGCIAVLLGGFGACRMEMMEKQTEQHVQQVEP